MSDFKFDCPKCGQNIVCDASNAGMQIPCPVCQTVLTVPQPPPAAPAAPGKLTINKVHHAPAQPPPGAASAPAQSTWGVKPPAPPPRKGRAGLPKWANIVILIVVLLGVLGGGAFAWMKYSEKKAQEKAAQDAVAAQARLEAEKKAKEAAAKAAAARASWRLDLASAAFPERAASGKLHGADFTVETVLFQNGILTLRQDSGLSRQFIVYLPVKTVELLAGKTFQAASTDTQREPQIALNWKNDTGKPPGAQNFTKGYSMKLEFGSPTDGKLSGKIYLCVPDAEQSFVAGHFEIGPKKVAGQSATGQPSAESRAAIKVNQT